MSTETTTTITYTCDRCGMSQEKPFRSKGSVSIHHDLHDWQGAAVAGFDRTLDLCDTCLRQVLDVVLATTTPPPALDQTDERQA